ncbi:MAG: ribosome small subunit-dependent GTPase A [Firmicutes bacterium]|nr:ribosome small subunit-dependent GTPase A [Bacillota bacterium]
MGDLVKIRPLQGNEGVIEDILPRTNYINRPPVANVSQLVAVLSASRPQLDYHLLDRLLVCAEKNDLRSLICINKIDLVEQNVIQRELEPYRKALYPVIFTSATREKGLDRLRSALKNNISVFAGPSGAGKSTLLNKLSPGANLRTGDVSRKGRRGRHTTRHVELLSLGDGSFVVDTPGFTRLNLEEITVEELGDLFPEILRRRGRCRFRNCLHEQESGCSIKKAVEDEEFSPARYKRYLLFLEEIRKIRKKRELTGKGD